MAYLVCEIGALSGNLAKLQVEGMVTDHLNLGDE
jgi:hypothetical protein